MPSFSLAASDGIFFASPPSKIGSCSRHEFFGAVHRSSLKSLSRHPPCTISLYIIPLLFQDHIRLFVSNLHSHSSAGFFIRLAFVRLTSASNIINQFLRRKQIYNKRPKRSVNNGWTVGDINNTFSRHNTASSIEYFTQVSTVGYKCCTRESASFYTSSPWLVRR